jgi:hypothetical protein
MDIEARLRQLEFSYRAALNAAVVPKTTYFALAGDLSALSAAVNRAKARWRRLRRSFLFPSGLSFERARDRGPRDGKRTPRRSGRPGPVAAVG